MKFTNATFALSATDLANHLSCKHLTQLNRSLAKGKIAPPSWRDPDHDRLRELGMAHENAFVGHLRIKGLQVTELRDEEGFLPLHRETLRLPSRQTMAKVQKSQPQFRLLHCRFAILLLSPTLRLPPNSTY